MSAEKKAQVLQLDPPIELEFKGGAVNIRARGKDALA